MGIQPLLWVAVSAIFCSEIPTDEIPRLHFC
jgi:hypothetical protein